MAHFVFNKKNKSLYLKKGDRSIKVKKGDGSKKTAKTLTAKHIVLIKEA